VIAVTDDTQHPVDEKLSLLRSTFAENPGDLDAGSRLAQRYADLGWYNEAIEVYRGLITQHQDNFSLLLDYGNTCFKKQDHEEARSVFKKLTVINPCRIEGWNNLGIVQLALKDNNAAILSFKKVLELEPDNAGALLNLGNCYDREGKAQEASALFLKAATVRPYFADAWFNLGNAYLGAGDAKKAVDAYKRAIRLQREFPSALKNLGVAYEQTGGFDEALDCYTKALQLNKTDSGLYVNLGNVAVKKKEYDQAKQWYSRAVTLSPREMAGWMGLRHLALVKGDIDGYVKSTLAVLPRLDAAAISESAMVLRELSHFAEADDLIGRAESLGISGDEFDAERMLSTLRKSSGTGTAAALYKRLRASNKPSDHVLACCALYAYQNGRLEDAIGFARRCTARDAMLEAMLWEGMIAEHKIDEAEAAIQEYLRRHVDCPPAWFLLAKIRADQQETTQARQYLARALESGFSDLDKIASDPALHEILLSLKIDPDSADSP
jgi:tetratricopeptide (TPR) repeat protein